jgi:hypothetical protein
LTEALSNGGEGDIRAAKSLETGLADFAQLFPAANDGLISSGDAAAISEALISENVQDHLPALRGAVRATLDRIKDRYIQRRSAYAKSLESVLKEVEAMPEWSRLEPDDRDELAGRFTSAGLPETPSQGRELADLRLVLARETAIGSLRAEVEGEVQRRLPAPTPPPEPKEAPTEEVVELTDLIVPNVIRTEGDLEGWLSSLRTQLRELLKSNRIIRIKKRSE